MCDRDGRDEIASKCWSNDKFALNPPINIGNTSFGLVLLLLLAHWPLLLSHTRAIHFLQLEADVVGFLHAIST